MLSTVENKKVSSTKLLGLFKNYFLIISFSDQISTWKSSRRAAEWFCGWMATILQHTTVILEWIHNNSSVREKKGTKRSSTKKVGINSYWKPALDNLIKNWMVRKGWPGLWPEKWNGQRLNPKHGFYLI